MKHVGYCNIVWAVLVFVVVFVTISCQPDTSCRENMQVGLVCTFSESYLDENKQVRTLNIWDSITVIGLGQTDSLYANSKYLTQISLPLRHDEDSTTYQLIYHNQTDTLTIFHTPMQQFVSIECGCTYHHDILRLQCSHHWIDSIGMMETTVTRAGSTNLTLMHRAY